LLGHKVYPKLRHILSFLDHVNSGLSGLSGLKVLEANPQYGRWKNIALNGEKTGVLKKGSFIHSNEPWSSTLYKTSL